MALVKNMERISMDRNYVHQPVESCTYTVFTDDVRGKVLQIDTYGSKSRKIKGKKSQSLQFDAASAAILKEILTSHF